MMDTRQNFFVSVVIPTYNRQAMLGEAIDSVLAQTYAHVELIVVDDGSTDGTRALLSSYGDRLGVLRQPRRGVSAARNRGVAAARGALVAFLDSDDLWLPAKLEVQAAFFGAHPHALICQTEEIWHRDGRRVNPGKRHRKPSGEIFERSLELCLVSPSAVMIRRELLERVGGFDERLPACEDYDLWLRIGCRHPVHLIDRPLVVKRGGHPDQLSKTPGLDRFRIASLVNLLSSGQLSRSQERAARMVLKKKCAIYAAGCAKRGRLEEARHYLGLAERLGR
jgi:glycosyltransferase involved in cell wall biosynthesis